MVDSRTGQVPRVVAVDLALAFEVAAAGPFARSRLLVVLGAWRDRDALGVVVDAEVVWALAAAVVEVLVLVVVELAGTATLRLHLSFDFLRRLPAFRRLERVMNLSWSVVAWPVGVVAVAAVDVLAAAVANVPFVVAAEPRRPLAAAVVAAPVDRMSIERRERLHRLAGDFASLASFLDDVPCAEPDVRQQRDKDGDDVAYRVVVAASSQSVAGVEEQQHLSLQSWA